MPATQTIDFIAMSAARLSLLGPDTKRRELEQVEAAYRRGDKTFRIRFFNAEVDTRAYLERLGGRPEPLEYK